MKICKYTAIQMVHELIADAFSSTYAVLMKRSAGLVGRQDTYSSR